MIENNINEIKNIIFNKIFEENGVMDIEENEELVESGKISSLTLVQIILSLEEYIGKDILTDDVELENFSSIEGIIKVVESAMMN